MSGVEDRLKKIWTGGYRDAGGAKSWTGMWKWTDGSAFNFARWHEGQPDAIRGDEFYIQSHYDKNEGSTWFAYYNRRGFYGYVCKCQLKF